MTQFIGTSCSNCGANHVAGETCPNPGCMTQSAADDHFFPLEEDPYLEELGIDEYNRRQDAYQRKQDEKHEREGVERGAMSFAQWCKANPEDTSWDTEDDGYGEWFDSLPHEQQQAENENELLRWQADIRSRRNAYNAYLRDFQPEPIPDPEAENEDGYRAMLYGWYGWERANHLRTKDALKAAAEREVFAFSHKQGEWYKCVKYKGVWEQDGPFWGRAAKEFDFYYYPGSPDSLGFKAHGE